MAYDTIYVTGYGSTTEMLTTICSGIEVLGWESYDDISSTSQVYRSMGENGDYLPGYVHLQVVSTHIKVEAYTQWNLSTHTGVGGNYYHTYADIYYIADRFMHIYGNKDFIIVWVSYGGNATYKKYAIFGHIAPFDTTKTTLASSISAGSNVVATVSGTTNFSTERNYIIAGQNYEGRDVISINTISGSTMTIDSLPRDYAAGAVIGSNPLTMATFQSNLGYPVATYSMSGGTTSCGSVQTTTYVSFIVATTDADPNSSWGCYILQDWMFEETEAAYKAPIGYLSNPGIKVVPVNETTVNYDSDMYIIGNQQDASVSSATSNTIVDNTKSWVTNEFAGKVVVIVNGTSLGQTRIIASNTSTTITLNTSWFVIPVSGDLFKIVDEVYRAIAGYWGAKELI